MSSKRPQVLDLFVSCVAIAALSLFTIACDDDGESSTVDADAVTGTDATDDTGVPEDTSVSDTGADSTNPGDTSTDDTSTADTTATDTTTADTEPDVAPECTANGDCLDAAAPYCNPDTSACEAPPRGGLIGWGDGSASSVTLTKVFTGNSDFQATDLEFNPDRPNELWVALRHPHSLEPCESPQNATFAGCTALEGSVGIVTSADTDDRSQVIKTDENAWHFMRRPPALAFGQTDRFATCGEARTGNYLGDSGDFIGPTLWSSDLSVFAITPQGGNGSHLDMLHATPLCMGIAHEDANIYWTFNGKIGALDRYDFNDDHGPGNDDHSDGEIWRYAEGEVLRVADVPSHMVYRAADASLYVADTGNARIIKLDTTSGTPGGDVSPVYEPLQTATVMTGATVTEVVAPGTLTAPSGLLDHEGVLYVTDNATSVIHAFSLEGTPLRTLDTGLPAGSLAGIALGPDGRAYIVDLPNGDAYRIDPM